MRRTLGLTICILLIAMLASACAGIDASPSKPSPYGTYEIDPLFWAYFRQHGGVDKFGPVLTTIFTNSTGEKLQYVESGLLAYNPDESRFYFYPLGIELNLGELPDTHAVSPGDLLINGYQIHPALTGFYLDLGREIIGAPISNPHYNYAKNRLEQHFENLGLYYLLNDPSKTPHLLSYGLLACPSCQAYPTSESARIQKPVSNKSFLNYISSRGIPSDLLGDVVAGPVLVADSSTEMVFEHMALSSSNGQITIQAIPQSLGYSKTDLFTKIDNISLSFFPIQNGMGHNVFIEFERFINANGGYAVAGFPTTELFFVDLDSQVARQCFTNLCLDFYPTALEAKVRPAQLGLEYINQNIDKFPEEALLETPSKSTIARTSAPFSLFVWEGFSAINSFTPQTLSAMVFSHGVPQPNEILELYLNLPDNSQQLFYLPPTNENGRTGITIQPVAGENGDLVPYRVCLSIEGQKPICVKQSFMIWGNP